MNGSEWASVVNDINISDGVAKTYSDRRLTLLEKDLTGKLRDLELHLYKTMKFQCPGETKNHGIYYPVITIIKVELFLIRILSDIPGD